jgi:hypothetical protein
MDNTATLYTEMLRTTTVVPGAEDPRNREFNSPIILDTILSGAIVITLTVQREEVELAVRRRWCDHGGLIGSSRHHIQL